MQRLRRWRWHLSSGHGSGGVRLPRRRLRGLWTEHDMREWRLRHLFRLHRQFGQLSARLRRQRLRQRRHYLHHVRCRIPLRRGHLPTAQPLNRQRCLSASRILQRASRNSLSRFDGSIDDEIGRFGLMVTSKCRRAVPSGRRCLGARLQLSARHAGVES